MPAARPPRLRGFTLVEVLVVVAIVGVVALAATLAVGSGGERRLAREAERVQALIRHACEHAERTGREIGIDFAPGGFSFRRLGLDGWQALPGDGELRPRTWPAALRVELVRERRPVDVARGIGETPQLVCFSSGELTPFTLSLALGDTPATYRIEAQEDGTLERTRVVPAP